MLLLDILARLRTRYGLPKGIEEKVKGAIELEHRRLQDKQSSSLLPVEEHPADVSGGVEESPPQASKRDSLPSTKKSQRRPRKPDKVAELVVIHPLPIVEEPAAGPYATATWRGSPLEDSAASKASPYATSWMRGKGLDPCFAPPGCLLEEEDAEEEGAYAATLQSGEMPQWNMEGYATRISAPRVPERTGYRAPASGIYDATLRRGMVEEEEAEGDYLTPAQEPTASTARPFYAPADDK